MIADTASYLAYQVGWTAVRKMPEPAAYALFNQLADRAWRARGKGIIQYERNIARVVPDADPEELRDLSQRMMRSYMRYWCDAFRMPDWSQERIGSLHVEGEEHLVAAHEAGNGMVIVAPHSGNYDAGAAYLALAYGSCTTVAERLRPTKLFDAFVEFRARNGLEVLGTGDPQIMDVLAQRVAEGRNVGLVGERDLSRRGVSVEFFGETARMPAGAAALAVRTGAPFLPVGFWYHGEQPAATVFPPVAVRTDLPTDQAIADALQKAADAMAQSIAEHPHDWHMLQKIWVADLDPDRAPAGED